MNTVAALGRQTLQALREVSDFFALLTVLMRARMSFAHATRRRILHMLNHRQIFYTGVQGQVANAIMAVMVGSLLVFRLPSISKGEQITPALAELYLNIVFSELAPLLCAFLLIARSGTAITSRIGFQRVFGEFRTLRSLGIDPVHVFLVPVFFAFPISIILLVLAFDAVSLLAAYVTLWVQDHSISLPTLVLSVMQRIEGHDVVVVLIKSLLSSLFIGFYAIHYGSNMRSDLVHVAHTISTSTTRQLLVVFALHVGISMLVHLS